MLDMHFFVDGGYLRKLSQETGWPFVDPSVVLNFFNGIRMPQGITYRVTYYDGVKDDEDPESAISQYWDALEKQPFCHLGFGRVLGEGRKIKQKGVDTLIAVDMLSGAYNHAFKEAWLFAADADFVPVIEEVKRYGVMTGVVGYAGLPGPVSRDLRRVADLFYDIGANFLHRSQPRYVFKDAGYYYVQSKIENGPAEVRRIRVEDFDPPTEASK